MRISLSIRPEIKNILDEYAKSYKSRSKAVEYLIENIGNNNGTNT
jgi:metal-responsive CopG/Arc/MetJ family transcriptional regulator